MRTQNSSFLAVTWLAALCLVALADSASAASRSRYYSGQYSYVIRNQQVELAVTRLGGHMAPVTFYRDSREPLRPYHISPWQTERSVNLPAPVLVPLRGDFFCLPFGANAEEAGGERQPAHGEVATAQWKFVEARKTGDITTLALGMDLKVRPGQVTKELSLVDGHDVVYSRHIISGLSGPMPLGHHATLAMPEVEGTVRIATSAFRFGMTCATLFSDPKAGEYQQLLPGAKWSDLAKVPTAWKGAPDADLTRMPNRRGFADLVQVVNEPWEKTGGPAWVTATYVNDRVVWFALKDSDVLNSTVFWMENRGRHGSPWNGRNNCLGLEDVTACFAEGLAAATRENPLTREGVATAVKLSAQQPTAIRYIQGMVKVPAGFDHVRTLEFAPGKVTFVSVSGVRIDASVRHEFLRSGKL